MSKTKEITPKLRFPEFAKIADWKLKILGEVCDYWNGSSHESGVDENGEYYLISLNSIDIEGNLKSEMKRISYTDNSLQKDDLVMVLSDVAHGNFLGLTDIIPNNKYVLNQRMAGLRIKDLMLANPFFIRTFINYNQKYFKANGQGSSQLNLSKSSVTDFPILLPSIQEQQKIASCLSFLDDLISNHSQKLDLLKDHKKGLMQNLFPQEGENVPKLRFKEFENSGEWEENPLEKVVNDFIVPMRDKPKKLDGEIPWCRIEDFHGMYLTGSKSNQGVSLETIKEMNLKVYPAYTLLVTCSADLGKCAITQKPLVTNQTFIGLVPNDKKVSIIYLYYVMSNSKNELNARSSGTTISYLSRQQFEKFEIKLPNLKEQQKIASCLLSLDKAIEAQEEKIEQLKSHKKGLMQGLFPKTITN